LKPLDQEAVGEYIRTRLSAAGARNPEKIIPESAVEVIYRYSNGYPREINNISDNVLLLGYVEEKKKISPEMVTEYCEEMKLAAKPYLPQQEVVPLPEARGAGRRPGSARWKRFALAPALLVATLVLVAGLTKTGVIGRMAALLRTYFEDPAVAEDGRSENPAVAKDGKQENGKNGRIAWELPGKVEEDPSGLESSEGSRVRTVTVKEGDTLADLAIDVYGNGDQPTLDMLVEKNPAIAHVDMIVVGQRITFPPLPEQGNRSDSSE
jgi:phage tail protein X